MNFELNINIIRNFVTVAEMGNITNAAEKLYITQPTLSRQISSLESSLNVTLLERMKTGVTLTAAGESFYKQCCNLVKAYDELIGKVYEFHNIIAGTLNIGYQKSSEEMLISFNGRFAKDYPHVSIKNFRQTGDNFINRLIYGELDAAYIYGLELNRHYKNIKSIQVGMLQNMLLVSTENPLAKRKKVHLSELSNEKFVMPSKNTSPFKAQEIANGCKKYGYEPQVATTAENIIDYVLGIVQYNGIAILPYMRNMDDSDEVVYLDLEGYMADYPVHLAWNTANTNSVLPIYLSFIKQQPVLTPPIRQREL